MAELAFIPVVERVAEAEHSLLHRKTVQRSVSGAYVSLALRSHEVMTALETSGPEFLATFAQLADVDFLATSLHMREHPLWHDAANTPASAKRQCADTILYTLDSHVQYGSTESARSKRLAAQQLQAHSTRQWMGELKRREKGVGESSITTTSMACHIKATLLPGTLVSMPVKSARLQRLHDALAPPQDQMNISAVALHQPDLLESDAGDEHCCPDRTPPQHNACEVFMQIVNTNPSNAKLLMLPPVAMTKLRTDDICVTLHKALHGVPGSSEVYIDSEAQSACNVSSVVILNAGVDDPDAFSEMQLWKRKGEIRCVLEEDDGQLLQETVIRSLVQSQAFPGYSPNLVVGASDLLLHQQLVDLRAAGYVEEVLGGSNEGGRSQWTLTTHALKRLRVYETLCNPTPLFSMEPVPEGALPTATAWGLLMSLRAADWMLVRAPNHRAAREKLPSYIPGGLKRCYVVNKEQGQP